jgi:hypothetical protein
MPVWQPEASVHAPPETQAGGGGITLDELPPQADEATSAAQTENDRSEVRI